MILLNYIESLKVEDRGPQSGGPSVPYEGPDSVSLVLQISCKTYQGRGKIKLEDGKIRIGKRNALSAEIRYGPGLSIDKQTEEVEGW